MSDADYDYERALERVTRWCPPDLLNISCLKIAQLPLLPYSLTQLNCSFTNIRFLPDTLPKSLELLHCKNTLVSSLPRVLPKSLTYIDCSNSKLPQRKEEVGANHSRVAIC